MPEGFTLSAGQFEQDHQDSGMRESQPDNYVEGLVGSELGGAVSTEEKERMAAIADFEKNMSPEKLKLIMDKVQDLGVDGIAYSSLFTGEPFIDRNPPPSHGGDRLAEELFDIDPAIGEMKVSEFHKKRYELIDQHLFPIQLNRGLKKIEVVFGQGLVGTYRDYIFEQMQNNLASICGVSLDEIKLLWKERGREGVIELAQSKGINKDELDNKMKELEENTEKISPEDHKKFLKQARVEGRHALIHFNVTGRSSGWNYWRTSPDRSQEENDFLEISSTNWTSRHDNVCVIFDISNLEETPPGPKGRFDLDNDKTMPKTFTIASVVDTPGSKKVGLSKPRSEFGFITSTRIPPRKFRGLVYSSIKRDNIEYYDPKKQRIEYYGREYYSNEELVRLAKNIAATMIEVYKDHPERLLPVYDSKGNLLWPKQMDYDEVKKFVAERSAVGTE